MAAGDDAAAAGLTVFPSSQNHQLGYQNDNVRGDDIAHEITRAKAAEGALVPKTAFLVSATEPTHTGRTVGDIWFKTP